MSGVERSLIPAREWRCHCPGEHGRMKPEATQCPRCGTPRPSLIPFLHNGGVDDPRYKEEPCFDCDGVGCETCNDTGLLYTHEAIRLQLEAEEQSDDDA